MIDTIKTILTINPKASFNIINENNIETIVWQNGTSPISIENIKAKKQELIAEYNAKQYQRNRAKAYPSIQEQLDMQYWDKVNGTDNWEQAINAVKAQYPKV